MDNQIARGGLRMPIELIQAVADFGFGAVIVYMLYDMRQEARQQRDELWALLRYLVERDEQ